MRYATLCSGAGGFGLGFDRVGCQPDSASHHGAGAIMSFTYLASPYSDPDPEVRAQRYRSACKAAAYLLLRGHTVYSPYLVPDSKVKT